MSEEELRIRQEEIDRIFKMAWEDGTTFDEIGVQMGPRSARVVKQRRAKLKLSSFHAVTDSHRCL